VVVNDRGGNVEGEGASQAPAQLVVDEIKRAGGEAVAYSDDVSQVDGANNLIRQDFNYSDFSLFSPEYRKAGILGAIEGERMEKIISDYVLAFFDKYLRGKDTLLLKGPGANYTEVDFKSHRPQTKRKR